MSQNQQNTGEKQYGENYQQKEQYAQQFNFQQQYQPQQPNYLQYQQQEQQTQQFNMQQQQQPQQPNYQANNNFNDNQQNPQLMNKNFLPPSLQNQQGFPQLSSTGLNQNPFNASTPTTNIPQNYSPLKPIIPTFNIPGNIPSNPLNGVPQMQPLPAFDMNLGRFGGMPNFNPPTMQPFMTNFAMAQPQVARRDTQKEEELQKRITQLEEQLEADEKKQKKTITSLKKENNQLELEKQDLESLLSNAHSEIQKLKKKLDQSNQNEQNLQQQNQLLNEEKENLQQSINQMMMQSRNRNTIQQPGQLVSTNDDFFTKQINKLKAEKQQLEDQIKQYQKNIQTINNQLMELTNDCDKEHKNFLNAQDEVINRNKQIDLLRKKINEYEQSQLAVQNLLKERNNKIKELEIHIQDQEVKIQSLELDVQMKTDTIAKYKEILNSQGSKATSSINQQIEQFEAQKRKMAEQQNQNIEQQKQKIEKEKEQFFEKQNNERANQQQRKDRDKQLAEEARVKRMGLLGGIMAEAKREQGQLDVCFLVDVTGSMETYKEQTKQSVIGALQIIQQSVNRDTNWAAICYQDKAERKALGGKYHQIPFSKNYDQLQKWFDTIKCSGGGDGAEDIQGALEQMSQLNWPSKFKIAILICDAPCHGKKYHNGITSDDSPNDEIRGAIEKMIDQNIIFIGLNFTKLTTLMYEEFQKIFIAKKKEDLFLYQDLTNADKGKMSQQMVKYLGEASKNATHTNKRQTKSKNENQNAEVARNKDGAMESLCKSNNFYDFEKQNNVKCVDTKFKVLKVEIKQASFDKNMQTIEKLLVPSDYDVSEEGQWDCIRTQKPFAFGMMKDVFLMKKTNGSSQELYVIKTPIGSQPYKTLNDALTECRSHLICQKLMKKFQEDLSNKMEEKNIQKKYPSIVYSDFLILQESQYSFWIAERFFNGEFVKYNNNFGFIEEDINDMNKMAQAFSFYTYVQSDFNYMVSDVQGVGIYFTDPAINTKDGKFDETDMGLEGQQMYLVSYELKKNLLSREILEILDIYE